VLVLLFLFNFCSSTSASDVFDMVRQNNPAFLVQRDLVSTSTNADDDDNDCLMTQDFVSKGGDCDGDLMHETNSCSVLKGSPSCCAQGLYCVNSKCAVDNVGSLCKRSSDCLPDVVPYAAGSTAFPMACISGVCQYLSGPGDSCSVNSDCANNLACTLGKCAGLTSGVFCNISLPRNALRQCAFGFYCTGTCQPAGSLNATCFSDTQCAPGFFCGNDNQCVQTFTTPVGDSCSSSTTSGSNQQECKVGYTCNSRSTCVPITPSIIKCENQNECTTASSSSPSCSCQPSTGKSFCTGTSYNYDSCTQERYEYYTCMNTNQCSTISNQPSSCSYTSCSSSMNKLTKCLCSILKSQAGDAYYCNAGFATWKLIVSIVVPVVGIILLVIIVVVLVLSCRKNKEYEQI